MFRDREDLPRLARLRKEGKEIADFRLPNAKGKGHRKDSMQQAVTSSKASPGIAGGFGP